MRVLALLILCCVTGSAAAAEAHSFRLLRNWSGGMEFIDDASIERDGLKRKVRFLRIHQMGLLNPGEPVRFVAVEEKIVAYDCDWGTRETLTQSRVELDGSRGQWVDKEDNGSFDAFGFAFESPEFDLYGDVCEPDLTRPPGLPSIEAARAFGLSNMEPDYRPPPSLAPPPRLEVRPPPPDVLPPPRTPKFGLVTRSETRDRSLYLDWTTLTRFGPNASASTSWKFHKGSLGHGQTMKLVFDCDARTVAGAPETPAGVYPRSSERSATPRPVAGRPVLTRLLDMVCHGDRPARLLDEHQVHFDEQDARQSNL